MIKGVDVRLKEILLEVATEFDAEIIEMQAMSDHVHLQRSNRRYLIQIATDKGFQVIQHIWLADVVITTC